MGTCTATPVATQGKIYRMFSEFLVLVALWFSRTGKMYEFKTKEINNAKNKKTNLEKKCFSDRKKSASKSFKFGCPMSHLV